MRNSKGIARNSRNKSLPWSPPSEARQVGRSTGGHLHPVIRTTVVRGSTLAQSRRPIGIERYQRPAGEPGCRTNAARRIRYPKLRPVRGVMRNRNSFASSPPPGPPILQWSGRLCQRRKRICHHHRKRAAQTPAPWSNVLANPHFGTVVTESGTSYTWMGNAHEFRLTPWYNDPVSDTSGEALYIRDEESGYYWSPTPLPCKGNEQYTSRHGCRVQHLRAYGIGNSLEPLRIRRPSRPPSSSWSSPYEISRNDRAGFRQLSYVELVLGTQREEIRNACGYRNPHVIRRQSLHRIGITRILPAQSCFWMPPGATTP